MKINEYTLVKEEGKHMDGTPWQFWAVKLGDNLYYQTHDDKQIKTVQEIEFASRIATEQFALEQIGFLQNFFDENGLIRTENANKEIPPLVGLAEAAEMLGWDKRKVSTYVSRGTFPAPLRKLASGPIWTYKQIEDYKNSL
jgi:hypothetical protein